MSPPVPEDPARPLAERAAEAYVASTCFKTGPPELVGVELEWLVHDAADPCLPVRPDRLRAALPGPDDPLAALLSSEPGGQLEFSSPPAPLARCLAATAADLASLRSRLAGAGIALVGLGLDPYRPPVRTVHSPRYVAMERHFDRRGPAGRRMMCSTASVQVCLDAGADDAEIAARWSALHALGPVLVAMTANSPLSAGRPSGWKCGRQAVWLDIDPSRTRAPAVDVEDPRDAYARWALDADLLAVRRSSGGWVAPAGLTFRQWVRGGGPPGLPAPILADLDYHLSTLFPPVRARGHLELRILDAQSGDRWQAVAALVAALLDDAAALDAARAAAAPVSADWRVAARSAVADRELAVAARAVAEAGLAAVRRAGLPSGLVAGVERFVERYPARGRSPADDVLASWAAGPGSARIEAFGAEAVRR